MGAIVRGGGGGGGGKDCDLGALTGERGSSNKNRTSHHEYISLDSFGESHIILRD